MLSKPEEKQNEQRVLLASLVINPKYGANNKLLLPSKLPGDVLALYQKYQGSEEKNIFRKRIEAVLGEEFSVFQKYSNYLRNDGVLLFRDFVDEEKFEKLLDKYDKKMLNASQSQVGHSFLDFRDHEDFLTNQEFKDAFLHPLLIALISYELGGPVRLVDVRGKDVVPALTTIRDNGVHVDDSLYGSEYKVILLWEKGRIHGPRSQNFVAIPRSHRLVRVISSEHGANFKTPVEIIDEILGHPDLRDNPPFVMEAEDDRPLTIVFEASAIAHHRFRTLKKKFERSCLILAFHVDNRLNRPAAYVSVESADYDLDRFVIGGEKADEDPDAKVDYFVQLIEACKHDILQKLREVKHRHCLVTAEEKKLSKKDTINWLLTIAETPVVEDLKPRLKAYELGQRGFVEKLIEISEYDRHFDLDLQLYPDRRELARKSLRNRIREMDLHQVVRHSYAIRRFENLNQSCFKQILNPSTLMSLAERLCGFVDSLVDLLEPLGRAEELRSIHQLANDLGEAVGRCKNIQDFRTNSIFLYWTFNEVYELLRGYPDAALLREEIDGMSQLVLSHYAALVCFDDGCYERKEIDSHHLRKEIEDRLGKVSF